MRAGVISRHDKLYSNRSNALLEIVDDDVGRHDFLLTPCPKDTFRIIYGDQDPHRGCFGNLAAALAPYDIAPDDIPVAFNCFMNVPVDGMTGKLGVDPPLSKAGDRIVFRPSEDPITGLTACSALLVERLLNQADRLWGERALTAAGTRSSPAQLARAIRPGICGRVSRARNPIGPLAAPAA